MLLRAIALTIAAVFSAIAASPGSDGAQLYVYAPRDTAARSWLGVSCDGGLIAEIKAGTFFAINLTAGRQTLSVEKGVPLILETHAGQPSFVRLDWNYGINRRPIAVLSAVGPADARREMKYLSYIGARRVHSTLVPKADPSLPVEPELRSRDGY